MVTQASSAEHLEQLLQTTKPFVIDYFASWCGPCASFADIYEDLATKYPDVMFLKIDIDRFTQEQLRKLGVVSVPTIKVFKDSKLVGTVVGADETKLIGLLEQL